MNFYSLPPLSIPYPYIILNVNNPKYGYVRRHKDTIQSIIIDSGIEIFRDSNVREYPFDILNKIIRTYFKVKRIVDCEVFVTVPDYCDDYHPQNLWISKDYTNIERTLDNCIKYTEKYPTINWLIPIQGWNKDPNSLKRSISLLEDSGFTKDFNFFAIGNLCVELNIELIHKTAKYARTLLPDKRLHIFGAKLPSAPYIRPYVDSFDSIAWTRPVTHELGNWSCKTTEERIKFWNAWVDRLHELTSQPILSEIATEGDKT